MDYWYHRISHCSEAAYPLFDMDYLTFGLSEMALQYPKIVTENFSKTELRLMLEYTYRDRHTKKLFEKFKGVLKERTVPPISSFFSFVYEFKVGDKVMVPSYPEKEYFVICEILEKADLLNDTPSKDGGFC